MPEPACHPSATYQDILNLPENLIGEIINNTLITQPRPASPHAFACSILSSRLIHSYQRGGREENWWFLFEPEIHLGETSQSKGQILVPDLAGWRVEKMPKVPNVPYFTLMPDWVCEIISPSSAKRDRTDKMSIYTEHELKHLWIIDPEQKQLEIYRLLNQVLSPVDIFKGDTQVHAEPFFELTFPLKDLWT